jgi:hypothetical protein
VRTVPEDAPQGHPSGEHQPADEVSSLLISGPGREPPGLLFRWRAGRPGGDDGRDVLSDSRSAPASSRGSPAGSGEGRRPGLARGCRRRDGSGAAEGSAGGRSGVPSQYPRCSRENRLRPDKMGLWTILDRIAVHASENQDSL